MARVKLDLEKARRIRAWWAENIHQVHDGKATIAELRQQLAKEYGVHWKTISAILTQHTYREPNP